MGGVIMGKRAKISRRAIKLWTRDLSVEALKYTTLGPLVFPGLHDAHLDARLARRTQILARLRKLAEYAKSL